MVSIFQEEGAARPFPSVSEAICELIEDFRSEILARQLSVTVDVNSDVDKLVCPPAWRRAVRDLLNVVLRRSPRGNNIVVCGCRSLRSVEIEIADSGGEPEEFPVTPAFGYQPPTCNALLRQNGNDRSLSVWLATHRGAPALGLPTGTQLRCSRCPQGGYAWTLTFHDVSAARAAA